MRHWRLTLHNWRIFQVQSHVTQKLGQISNIRPNQIQILRPSLRISGLLPAPIVNGGGDSFRKWKDFQLPILTLTLDRVILHTVVYHSSTSTYNPNFIEIEETFCGWTDGRTYRWINRHLRLILLGRLRRVDQNPTIIIKWKIYHIFRNLLHSKILLQTKWSEKWSACSSNHKNGSTSHDEQKAMLAHYKNKVNLYSEL